MKVRRSPIPCLLAILMLSPLSMLAQCVPSYSTFLQCNKVYTQIQNGGDMWYDLHGRARNMVPYTPGGNQPAAGFAAGLWMAGKDAADSLHVTAQAYRAPGTDFYSGSLRTGFPYACSGEIAAPGNLNTDAFTQLADGRFILSALNGFVVYDEASGSATNIPVPGLHPETQCLQLPDGRLVLIADLSTLPQDIVYIMDTVSFTPAVACTLAGNYTAPVMHLLSTGKVLMLSLASEIFDPVTSTATLIATTPGKQGARAIGYPGDSLLVIGGALGSGSRWYDPATNAFNPGPLTSLTRAKFGMAPLPDGRYLLAGGCDSVQTDIYDPVTRSFSVGPPLLFPIGTANAAVLPSGKILFTGSTGIAVFDPVSFTFSSSRRNSDWCGMALLPSGKVLLQTDDSICQVFDPFTGMLVDEELQYIWNLTKEDVDAFRADYIAGTVDYSKYPDIYTWPGLGDTTLTETRYLAPFVDINNDNLYTPFYGDYPCITGAQSIWSVFHDDGEHSQSYGMPLGLEVESTSYAFNCSTTACPDSFLDYSTFYHYEISNRSGADYHDVYIGLWVDADMGHPFDDYIASDSTREMVMVYNGDAYDEQTSVNGYGSFPPAYGIRLLKTPFNLGLTHSMQIGDDLTAVTGFPVEPSDYYGYLKAEWKDSTHLVNNGTDGYPGSGSGPAINHIFPGNGGWCSPGTFGWSEVSAGNAPGHRVLVLSCGPMDLKADTTVSLDLTNIWARASFNANLGSVCGLLTASDAIAAWWQGQDLDCFLRTVANDPPHPDAGAGMEVFPNPSSGMFTLRFAEKPISDVVTGVYDLSGRLVLATRADALQGSYKLDCSSLPAGLYQLRCEMNGKVMSRKVVVE